MKFLLWYFKNSKIGDISKMVDHEGPGPHSLMKTLNKKLQPD